jgi:hypothetical protein
LVDVRAASCVAENRSPWTRSQSHFAWHIPISPRRSRRATRLPEHVCYSGKDQLADEGGVERDSGQTTVSCGQRGQFALPVSSKCEARTNVVSSEVRELRQQFLLFHSTGEILKYISYSHTSPADTWLPTAFPGLNRDDPLIVFLRHRRVILSYKTLDWHWRTRRTP